MRTAWPLLYHDRLACQFYVVKTLMRNERLMPFIKNHDVCINFFCGVNIIPLERAYRFAELINQGVENPIHPNTGRRFEHDSTVEKLAQLALYIEENFDSNPAKNSYLPQSRITKSAAAGEALQISPEKRKGTNFTKLFRKLNVQTHFVTGNALTKCNICTEFSFKLRKTSVSDAEKAKIKIEWEEHKVKIRNDRRDYKLRCILSTERPSKYCSIIHDGMCKMKTKIPLNNDHRSKKIENNDRMFCDGQNKTTTVGFFSPGSCYDNTTNAIISQLLYSISILPVVPPTVFIQIDNFPGNKSYLFFATFGYILLRQTAIKEFYVSFMMPGHTHCDVDARFGNFSSFLNSKECGSPQELISSFLECIPGEAQMKQSIYNFKEVLTPFCKNYGKVKSMYDFHIYLDGSNKAMVENSRFELSETLLCGTRQNCDSFVTPIFKNDPPLNLNFQLIGPKLEGIEKMMAHVKKWEKVISSTAKTELLNLKQEIESHTGIPFTTMLKTIEDKRVPLESIDERLTPPQDITTPESPRNLTTNEQILAETTLEEARVDPLNAPRRSARFNAVNPTTSNNNSRKRKAQINET